MGEALGEPGRLALRTPHTHADPSGFRRQQPITAPEPVNSTIYPPLSSSLGTKGLFRAKT